MKLISSSKLTYLLSHCLLVTIVKKYSRKVSLIYPSIMHGMQRMIKNEWIEESVCGGKMEWEKHCLHNGRHHYCHHFFFLPFCFHSSTQQQCLTVIMAIIALIITPFSGRFLLSKKQRVWQKHKKVKKNVRDQRKKLEPNEWICVHKWLWCIRTCAAI